MKLDVINLDGVVNPGAMKAIRDNRLPDYIQSMNIGYLIEHDFREAANFHLVYADRRFELRPLIDLTKFYKPYKEDYTKKTYLWKLEVRKK